MEKVVPKPLDCIQDDDLLVPNYPLTEIIRLETLDTVAENLGISRSGIYDRMNPASKYFDSDFPRPIYLGESTARFIVFEVNRFILKKMQNRDFKNNLKKIKNNEIQDE